MSKKEDISMIRLTDDSGEQFVAACVSEGSCGLLSLGEADSWTEHCRPITSVIIDASAALQVTDPRDLESLSAWLSAAAMWLRVALVAEDDDEISL